MKLRRYILRRLGIMIIQIAGVITLSFFIMRALPGDPVEARLGMMATEESKAMLRERMGQHERYSCSDDVPWTDGVFHSSMASSNA